MLHYAILTFFISFIVSAIIIRLYSKPIGERAGPQQFHKRPTPRFGGVGLYLVLVGAVLLSYLKKDIFADSLLLLTLISFPVFLSGFLEDLTNRLKPKIRLIFMLFSAALAFFILDVKVVRVDLPYIDSLMAVTSVSFIFTVLALTGIANAVNIIDGFNGLASMVCFCILMAIAYVAYKLGDYYIVTSCVLFAFALLGFFILNYPFGFIFLGDCGAYLSGFVVGVLSILLVKRHSEVSAWFALLVNFYPVYETIFSVYRRKFLRNQSPAQPDGLHMHTLFYKIITKKILGVSKYHLRNNITSPFVWILNLIAVLPAILFWNNTPVLIGFTILFAVIYTKIYWSLIRYRMPKSFKI